jgi:hypothetical protein
MEEEIRKYGFELQIWDIKYQYSFQDTRKVIGFREGFLYTKGHSNKLRFYYKDISKTWLPILRTLDLTKEIEVEGERFKPADKLSYTDNVT